MTNILNYTSSVPSDRSISGIERMLAQAGATNISKMYKDQRVVAIWFGLTIGSDKMAFRLPARVEAVAKVLCEQVKRPRLGTLDRLKNQAERTAWKILFDWCAAQLALIRLEQAEAVEVFLPYLYNPETEQTLFQSIKQSGYKLLLKG